MITFSLIRIADENDCYIKTDKDGDYALARREYADGIEQVKYAPAPCNYHSEAEWRGASEAQIQAWLC